MAVYTIVGGIDAVIWTDVIQTIVLLLGGIVCFFVIVNALPGGIEQLIGVAVADGKLAFSELRDGSLHEVGWNLSLFDKTATMMLLVGLVMFLTEYSSNQNTVQRFCASKSDADARRAMFICALVSVPTWAFFMFLGTALYVFFQVFPTAAAEEMLQGARKAEEILPYFVAHHLPGGLVGLVIAAALAAAMSSLDSSINAISTVSIHDVYRRFARVERSDRHYLRVARIIAAVVSLVMGGGALLLLATETKTLQDTATIVLSLLAGGLLSIYLIGFFSTRGDARHILCGIAGTMLFTAWTILSARALLPETLSFPFDLYYAAFLGNVVMFLVAFGLSFFWLSPAKGK